jgi:hypothetical protein
MNKKWAIVPVGREEKGSAVIILTLAVSVLVGAAALVADIGVAYVKQQRLSVAADAAALAGGQELHLGAARARQAALRNAARNGINSEDIEVIVEGDSRTLSVRIATPMEKFFASVLGVGESGKLTAVARVTSATPTAIYGAAPLAVRKQEFEFGRTYTLKVGAGGDSGLGPGNFGALALGGNGANIYQKNLQYGFPGLIRIGDLVRTKPGNMSGPTRDALNFRLNQPHAPQCDFSTIVSGCQRILLVPVVEPPTEGSGGVNNLRVVGFAAFYVEQVPGQGRESYIRGRFVKIYRGGQESVVADGFGISAAKLVK